MERIILASSNSGDMVADFFCGSGATPFVAAKYGRKFIACDETFHALLTTRGRLVDSQSRFSLERNSTSAFNLSSASRSVKAHISNDSFRVEAKLDPDYWEVDPAWNGKLFKSVAQAKRPVRSE